MKYLFTAIIICTYLHIQAQESGGNAYLQSPYIEMGINSFGNCITTDETPAGYVSAPALGIIADADKDGWDTGVPVFSGDYILSDAPLDGFIFEHNGNAFANFGIAQDIAGEFSDYASDADTVRITWEGQLDDASGFILFQEILIPKNELYALVRITILNASFDFQYGLKYLRAINPSPEFAYSGEVQTVNTITSNFPDDAAAVVSSAGLTAAGNYFGIVSGDPRAKVSYANLDPAGSYTIADALAGNAPFNVSGSNTSDDAVAIAFDMDSIYPCSAEMFSYAYVFSDDEETIAHALAATSMDDYGAVCTGVLYFDVSDVGYTSASIHFDTEEGMDYVIEYGATASGESSEFGTTDGAVALLGLEECTEYEVMVWSLCAGDTLPSISSQIFTTKCSDTGSVNIQSAENLGIAIYPNPANTVLQIALAKPYANAVCTIRDIRGSSVVTSTLQQGITTNSIDITSLPPGMYIMELQANDILVREQFLIIR